jgi:hypothetical protein
MAGADYRRCDQCGGKTFYDARLDYQAPDAEHNHEWWLHGVGDWAVICPKCAEDFVCGIMRKSDLSPSPTIPEPLAPEA